MSPGIENHHHPWLLWVNNILSQPWEGKKKAMTNRSSPDMDLNRSTKKQLGQKRDNLISSS